MRELITSQNSSRFKNHRRNNAGDEEPTRLTDYYNEANAVSLAILANHLEHTRLLQDAEKCYLWYSFFKWSMDEHDAVALYKCQQAHALTKKIFKESAKSNSLIERASQRFDTCTLKMNVR